MMRSAISVDDVREWGSSLETSLESLSDDLLGTATLQSAYNGFTFDAPVDRDDSYYISTVSTMANSIRGRALSKQHVVESLASDARAAFESNSGSYTTARCCNVARSSTTWDPTFLSSRVNKDAACLRVPSSTTTSGSEYYRDLRAAHGPLVAETFESNLQNSEGLAWQYVGMESTGVFEIYPSNQASTCGSYDPRFRPWYVLASQPQPKSVVIIIDTSGSMGTTRLNLAKEAALTALGTLNPNDYVSIIEFNSDPGTPDAPEQHECMQTRMAPAGPTVVEQLSGYVAGLRSGGGTYYNTALDKAFTMLEDTRESEFSSGGIEAILFLTDGVQSDSSSNTIAKLEAQKSAAALAGRTLKVFVYGLGSGILNNFSARSALTNMGNVFETAAEFVSDGGDLRSVMGRWYSTLSAPSADPVFTSPYFDVSGLGMVVTVAQAVTSGGSLVGVAGADISLEELVEEVQDFGAEDGAKLNYGILLNTYGTTLVHPSLPALSGWADSPPKIDISDLEPHTNFGSIVRAQMLLGDDTGSATLNATRMMSRGDAADDSTAHQFGAGLVGGVEVEVEQTYYWSRVTGTPYIVAIVVASPRTPPTLETSLSAVGISSSLSGEMRSAGAGVYHRVDLYEEQYVEELNKCQYAVSSGISLSQAYSSYKLAPRSFVDPYAYLVTPEDEACVAVLNDANRMSLTVEGSQSGWDACETRPTADAVRDIFATRALDTFWRSRSSDSDGVDFALWRYVGTSSGVWRVFPGHPSSKRYDPTQRPWYTLAVSHAGTTDLVVTTPYLDATTGSPVITLAQSVAPTVSDVQEAETTAAVTAIDFSLGKFADMVLDASRIGSHARCDSAFRRSSSSERFPSSGRVVCFVMDDRGLIVYHPAFLLKENSEVGDLALISGLQDVVGEMGTVNTVLEQTGLSSVFVGALEPFIGEDLLEEGLLTRSTCKDVSERASVTTYSVNAAAFGAHGDNDGGVLDRTIQGNTAGFTATERFTMQKVEGTNLYLFSVESEESMKGAGGCTCDSTIGATTMGASYSRVDGQCSMDGYSVCIPSGTPETNLGPCRCKLDWNACFGDFSRKTYWFGDVGQVEVSASGIYSANPVTHTDNMPICPASPVALASDIDIEDDEHVTTALDLYNQRLPECTAVRPTSCSSVNEMFGTWDGETSYLSDDEQLEMAEYCSSLEGCLVLRLPLDRLDDGAQDRLRCQSAYEEDLASVEDEAGVGNVLDEILEEANTYVAAAAAAGGLAVFAGLIVGVRRQKKKEAMKAAQDRQRQPTAASAQAPVHTRPGGFSGHNPMPVQQPQQAYPAAAHHATAAGYGGPPAQPHMASYPAQVPMQQVGYPAHQPSEYPAHQQGAYPAQQLGYAPGVPPPQQAPAALGAYPGMQRQGPAAPPTYGQPPSSGMV